MPTVLMRLFSAKKILKNTPIEGELPSDETLLRCTIRMAWPSMLESMLIAVVSVVDTIMVSSLGAYAIAAVGLTAQPKFICLAVFISLSLAVSALVARRRGEQDKDGANRVLIQALMLTVILTAVISTLAVIFAPSILQLAGSNADTHDSAVVYFRIIVGGQVFQAITMMINAAQRGVGNTKIAMRTNIVSNLINIVFNYLLIGGNFGFPRMGVAGAAIATVIGTVVACVMSIISVLHSEGFIYLLYHKIQLRFERETLKSIQNIGAPSLAEQLFLRIGFLMYSMIVANLGTTAFAAHQIGMNVIMISFAVGDGLSVASVALVGQSLGQKRRDLARLYASICQRIGLVCSLLVAIIYSTIGGDIFLLFSKEQELLDYGFVVMRFVAVIVVMQVAQVIYTGCLRGAGDTRYTAVVSLISVTFVRPFSGWLFAYPLGLGLTGAWIGIALDQAVRLVLTLIRFRSGKWTSIKI